MGDDSLNCSDETKSALDCRGNVKSTTDFPETLVTEKIIFCVDVLLLGKEDNSNSIIYNLLKSYFTLKKKICVKPPEFECLLVTNSDTIVHFNINSAKDIQSALKYVENVKYDEEKKPQELDKLFLNLACLVELPDPEHSEECVPPNWVYHVIWLFSRNLYVPTLSNMNPLNFLMSSSYFALDILYVYDNSLPNNCCEEISHILLSLNQNEKGYFLNAMFNDCAKIYSCFAQFLGHPLMRSPQLSAKFNIFDLGPRSSSPGATVKESDDEN